jgi:hypothetical protein
MPKIESNLIDLPTGFPFPQTHSKTTDRSGTIGYDEIRNAVCVEITDCLISSALVTNAINILVSHKHTRCIDHIFRYLPGDPPTVTALLTGLVPIALDSATLVALTSLLEKIEHGKSLIKQCEVFDGQCSDLDSRELAHLALCWRHVCALGIATLCCLERSCKPFWSTEKLRTLDRLIELLGSARNGESPYLGADSYPLVPHWAEQRRDRRQSVNLSARVHADGDTHHARLVDISDRGIGLDRIFGLRPGRRVAVEAEDGNRFDGVVTWTSAGRAGVELRDK